LSAEIVKAGTFLNRKGKAKDKGKDKSNRRFLHCGGKSAASGRNDGGWVMRREQATATAIADFLHCGGKVRRLRSK